MSISYATFRSNIQRLLGDTTSAIWSTSDLDYFTKLSIRQVVGDLPADALIDWYIYTELTRTTTNIYTVPLCDKIISVQFEESDGEYGRPAQEVSFATLEIIRIDEETQSQDDTPTRIWSPIPFGYANTANTDVENKYIRLYPALGTSRLLRVTYIATVGEAAIYLPSTYEQVTLHYALYLANSKKSFDLNTAQYHLNQYNILIDKFKTDLKNKYMVDPNRQKKVRRTI